MTKSDPETNLNWKLVFTCWIIASVSALGSMFFSEIMELPPCELCWYQRVFMFPLVFIFLAGLFPFDKNIVRYSLPLAVAGWGVAFYHVLLSSGIIPETLQPCRKGISCSETYLDLFGFITIPMLSLITFTTIVALIIVLRWRLSR